MKYSIVKIEKGLLIQIRVEGENMIGDSFIEIHPGETFLGMSYQELMKLGEGEHEYQT